MSICQLTSTSTPGKHILGGRFNTAVHNKATLMVNTTNFVQEQVRNKRQLKIMVVCVTIDIT